MLWKLDAKETQAQRKWREAQGAGNWDNENELGRKLTLLSLRFPKTSS